MSMPYVVSEAVWNAKAATETVALKTDFEKCQVTIIEITTAGFSGTIDLQGKLHELTAFSNIPYIRQDQATIQTPSVAQISYALDTGVYRYVILGYWRRFQLVMTRTAGTITCGVVGSSSAKVFPYLPTKLLANSGVDIGDVDILSIAAGINRIGTMSGVVKTIRKTVELAAAGDYAAEDVLSNSASAGVAWSWLALFRADNTKGYITKVHAMCEVTALTPRLTIYFFKAAPTNCNLNDNVGNTAPHHSDKANYVGKVDLPALEDLGGMSEAVASPSTYGNLPLLVEAASNADDLHGVVVTRDAITAEVATMELTLDVTMEQY